MGGPSRGEALALLYERHYGELVRLAFALTGDWGLAEELAQEAFVRVWRSSTIAATAAGSERISRVSWRLSHSSIETTTAAGRPLRVTVTWSCCCWTRAISSDNRALTSASGNVSIV